MQQQCFELSGSNFHIGGGIVRNTEVERSLRWQRDARQRQSHHCLHMTSTNRGFLLISSAGMFDREPFNNDESYMEDSGYGQHHTSMTSVRLPEEVVTYSSKEFRDGTEGKAEGDSFGSMGNVVLKALEKALGSPLDTGPQASPSKPLVIVISGPSGVGKDAVIKRLQEVRPDLHFVVTATSRPQRPGEVDGKDYFFVSKEDFSTMIQENELLEYALVYGDYKGIPKLQVKDAMAKGTDVVLRLDVQGAATVRSILGPNAVFIFLVAESEVALVKRLVERKTESMEKILIRIKTARDEMIRLEEFDYVVVNAHGQLEKAVQTMCSIIDAEKSRVSPRVAVF